MPERVCGALWLKAYPEALCQLESGHAGEHWHKNKVYSVIWTGDANAKSQKKIVLAGEPK